MNKWIKKDLRHIWHPYTQMKDCEKFPPILIERARGTKIYDSKGNAYYDTISSWWCNVHGHNHPRIKQAIKEQLDRLEHVLFAGFTHKPAVSLAEKLISITPKSLSRVFFSDNGSTAVETALKMSFQYWQNKGVRKKTKFISLDLGYHGDTFGAMSISGVGLFNSIFKPLLFRSFKIPAPYCYRCPVKRSYPGCDIACLGPLDKLLRKKSGEISALILEPLLMAAGGMIVYPAEYLRKASRLAARYNVHFIVDEVATGFGRTGKMFACEHAGVLPDFMCLSKGITSGYLPLGATLTTEKVYRAFYGDYKKGKTFFHGHTFTANPVSCSAALASLRVFREEGTLGRVVALGARFHRSLERFNVLDLAGDVRYIGMVGAIELVKDKKTKKPFGIKERMGLRIYEEGLARGLILRPLGNIVYLFLPFCIKEKELDHVSAGTFDIVKNLRNLT